ncbi:peptidoglycan-associated lipoprotein Pal [Desulfovermiculus halophilus]|uniref:peptidoglycan-associated lipoprotein Pal n=1 Tax=Desulfovermiculus halophilus TaxID=339722 RepID=UPI000684F235|nr:peptidoglycan-associated lipoprotein Pal [Desulfovermiculus halophilus]
MRRYGWMTVCVVGCAVLVLLVQGCARKPVGSGSEGLSADQAGAYSANGTGVAGDGTSQMTAEEMEEYRLKEQARREKAKAEQAKDEQQKEQAVQELTKRIHFAFDSYELRVDARQTLKKKAEILDRHSDIDLTIEGHCDSRGTDEYNLALGERRARAAYEFMVLLGIDPDRMNIISYGEERPLDPRNTEEAWAKNRRCEFRVAD